MVHMNPFLEEKWWHQKLKKNYSKQIQLPDMIDREIMLYIDILFINGNPFLHVKSKNLNYVSVEFLKDRKMDTICKKLPKICDMYRKRGFTITDAYGDNEFNHDSCKEIILPGRMHICTRGEHVPIIERSVRTLKEKARTICQSLPYSNLPKIMVQALMDQVQKWLNVFPPLDNLDSLSPAALVNGDEKPNFEMK